MWLQGVKQDMGWEDERMLKHLTESESDKPGPTEPATVDPRQRWGWQLTTLFGLFLVIKLDIDFKKMYYFLLNAKEASEDNVTYFISRTREPEMNYGLAVTLTPRAKILITIVIFHVIFLILNLYVFTKMAEDIDISLFGRKRKY